MSADSKILQQACEVEDDNMKAKGVWMLVRRPSNKNFTRGLWLFKVKHDTSGSVAKHKSRLVAMGKLKNPVMISTKFSVQLVNQHTFACWLLFPPSLDGEFVKCTR